MKLKQIDFKKILIWISVPLLFWGTVVLVCVQSCSGKTNASQQHPKNVVDSLQVFRLPDIPSTIDNPEQRAEYLAIHYWENYDFTDTARIHNPAATEQILADYIAILPYVSEPIAKGSIFEMMHRAEEGKHLFLFFAELLEKYLYDPNSPMRNEEYYLHVLRYIEASPVLDNIQKPRFAYQLQSTLKNRKGTVAADFTYTLANGRNRKMHSIKSDYLLLFFHNPGCESCQEIKTALQNSPIITGLLESKKLTVLAVYPDENPDEWKTHLPHLPSAWINGYDAAHVVKNELYDLRAIPSLYLLDKRKKVLLKDGTVEQVEQLLTANSTSGI